MESSGAPGGRKCTHAPRQQSKCSLAGRTRALTFSCPLNPDAWSHLTKTLPVAVPGSWALTEGAAWPTGPRVPCLDLPRPGWPALTTWPVVSPPGPHPQWAWARWLAQELTEGLAWVRGQLRVVVPDGGPRERCAEGTAQSRGVEGKERGEMDQDRPGAGQTGGCEGNLWNQAREGQALQATTGPLADPAGMQP